MDIEFEKLFNEVFDNHGDVKNCGREKCKDLIQMSMSLKSGEDFGNLKTGFMNTENIKKLYIEELKKDFSNVKK